MKQVAGFNTVMDEVCNKDLHLLCFLRFLSHRELSAASDSKHAAADTGTAITIAATQTRSVILPCAFFPLSH